MRLLILAILIFAGCNRDHRDIGMVGDSHMKRGQWDSMGLHVYNLGGSGQTIAQAMQQVPVLKRYKPSICFIECGTNDIYKDSTYAQMTRDYQQLIDNIRPICTPVAVKLMYIADLAPACAAFNTRVDSLNTFIDSLGIATIDLNRLVSADGYLRPEYAMPDGTHLNEEGYKLFAQSVKCWLYRREMGKWYNRLLLR